MPIGNHIPYIALIFGTTLLNAWEEDPRIAEDNEKTAKLLEVIERQLQEEYPETIDLLNWIHQEKKKTGEEKDE